MMQYSRKGFTLVELIIVIVILTILATVGFISYEDYLVNARDGKRIAQISGLRDAMRLSITRGVLPLPDNKVDIRNNGNTFLYQGYAGKNVLSSVSFTENTKDPKDETYYTYLVSSNRTDFQLLAFLEKYNPDVITSTFPLSYAGNYSQRYPNIVGKKLGVLLEQTTNTPLQELSPFTNSGYIDISTDASGKLFDAYVTDTYIISGSGSALSGIIPFTTCKKILENGDSYGDGIYNINPSGTNPFEVYCNMTLDGGGWTLVGRSVVGAATGNFGWFFPNGDVRDDNNIYALGMSVVDLNFSQILLSTYTTGKNIDYALQVSIDKNFIKSSSNYKLDQATSSCTEVYPTISSWLSACDISPTDGKTSGSRNQFRYWGFFEKSDSSGYTDNRFHFRNGNGTNYGSFGLTRNGYIQPDADSMGIFLNRQGMIFVR